ncbi:Outer membrane receptor for ferrienterochelin and colicins [Mucilaginibacter pineti]|uniref:Outer membrane receptor for ferrienterochelin and colicins n=1 Tax=Mucilaginibacter pineti TaxID=1391627 RepID=A0A1G6WJI6_9SPHI|nr:outer membrane beta-barrel family protein [Mucilaginibacter pineti]SDD65968.1 Outer membrane receptor for ferrienterochelin and colicins [Mucilaginibacter pineti]
MKRFYTFIALICFAVSAHAQFGGTASGPSITGRISGTVIDSVTKKPMDYTTVGLYRSGGKSPINGVVTDDKGNFKIDGIKPGSYKIVISFIGYPSKTIDPIVTSASKPDNKMGTVLLAPGAHALAEVNVVGATPLIENRIDKIVYNAEKDLTAAGGNATDLLSKVPLVSVDINGNVSVRGDQNVRVLINGKPSGATSANLSDVLKAIPADQIKTIEVITSPSAKYDAEGSAGIINIITKQKNVSGLSGGISGGVGTRQNNGNLNLNYNKNRFNLTTNIGGNASWPQTSLTEFHQEINSDSIHSVTDSKGTSRLKRHAVVGSVGAGYEFNGYNSINTTFKFNQIQFNTNGESNTVSATPYSNTTTNRNKIDGFDWNLDYTHKFKKEGEELDLSTQWSHNSGITDYTNIYTAAFPNLQNNIDARSNEYTFQADYILPINKTFKLEAGGKTILRRINSASDYFTYTAGAFVVDPIRSNTYNYNQNVFAGYSVFTITLPKDYSILAGFRLENTDIHGEPFNAAQDLAPFDQNYNTYVPSLTIQKKLSATNTLKLSYTKRISRPSIQYLNPFVNQNNIQGQTIGNPTLNPEVSQTVELGLNSFIKTSILNLSVYYKHTSGLIEGIASPISVIVDGAEQGGTLTTYQNIGNNNSLGGSFFGTINPFKFLTIIGNINAYTYKPDPSGVFHLAQSQNGTSIQYGGFLRATATLPSNFLAETFAFGNSSRRTIQGTTPTFSIFGVGVKKQLMQKKMAIGVNVISPFAEYKSFNSDLRSPGFVQTSKFQLPFRSYGLTFSYNFGKLNFTAPKKGVNNDDLKQGDQGMGGGGAPAGGR